MAVAFRLSFEGSPFFVPHLRVWFEELEAESSGRESRGMLEEFPRVVVDSRSALNVARLSMGVVVMEGANPESLLTLLSRDLDGNRVGSGGTC